MLATVDAAAAVRLAAVPKTASRAGSRVNTDEVAVFPFPILTESPSSGGGARALDGPGPPRGRERITLIRWKCGHVEGRSPVLMKEAPQ